MTTYQDLEDAHEHHLTTLLAFQTFVTKVNVWWERELLLPILTTWTRWVFDWDGGGDVKTDWTGPLDLLYPTGATLSADTIKTTWSFAEMFVQTEIHLLKK